MLRAMEVRLPPRVALEVLNDSSLDQVAIIIPFRYSYNETTNSTARTEQQTNQKDTYLTFARKQTNC
jgi:hypothetical protein